LCHIPRTLIYHDVTRQKQLNPTAKRSRQGKIWMNSVSMGTKKEKAYFVNETGKK
jgi:hypothetical protein